MADDLFDDFGPYDVLCTFAILFCSIIAAGGGLGGGGVFVPIYILILAFEAKKAAALSQATIFGGSIVNIIMNYQQFHPYRKHRPLTDFPTILIFGPMLLIGTVIGVLLNEVFPDGVILLLLVIVLVYCTIRTTRKGIRMWKSETNAAALEEHREQLQLQYPTAQESDPLLINEDTGVTVLNSSDSDAEEEENTNFENDSSMNNAGADEHKMHELSDLSAANNGGGGKLLNQNDGGLSLAYMKFINIAEACGLTAPLSEDDELRMGKLAPYIEAETEVWKPTLIIFLVWIVISSTSIGKSSEITGITTCSTAYWVIDFCSFPVMILVAAYFSYHAVESYKRKQDLGWLPYRMRIGGSASNLVAIEGGEAGAGDADGDANGNNNNNAHVQEFGDIAWDLRKGILYPMIATIAGLLGGLLGIGGGMIVSPLLMELGVIPRVAAATSALAVLITSSSATLQFVLLGYLQIGFMFWFMAIGIIGTFIGQTVVDFAIKKYGRVSLIIFAVCAIMGGAVLLMGIDGCMEWANGTLAWSFDSPC